MSAAQPRTCLLASNAQTEIIAFTDRGRLSTALCRLVKMRVAGRPTAVIFTW